MFKRWSSIASSRVGWSANRMACQDGLRARVACVDTRVLDERFAGRSFDYSLLDDLPANVDPCGENGEFHTCVYDGPMFHELIDLEPGHLESRSPFTWAELTLRLGSGQALRA